jgi:hypothetical protein
MTANAIPWTRRIAAAATLCLLLAACSSQPPAPAWQMDSHGASQRALEAYLSGNQRVATLEWQHARQAIARTGQPARMARLELLQCAAQTASAMPWDCPRFEALRTDAAGPERAYAAYLAGQALDPMQAALLPPAQQALALATTDAAAAAHVLQLSDPLARLVAAGVLLRRSQASPAVVQAAVDTASQQGWRRPLLAWLGVQRQWAEQGGQPDVAARIRRRMDLVEQGAAP